MLARASHFGEIAQAGSRRLGCVPSLRQRQSFQRKRTRMHTHPCNSGLAVIQETHARNDHRPGRMSAAQLITGANMHAAIHHCPRTSVAKAKRLRSPPDMPLKTIDKLNKHTPWPRRHTAGAQQAHSRCAAYRRPDVAAMKPI